MPMQTERDAKLVSWRGKCIHDMPTKHLQIVLRLQCVLGQRRGKWCGIGMIDITRCWDVDIRRIRPVIPYNFTPKPHLVKAQHIITLPFAELEIALDADADILRLMRHRPLRIAATVPR